MRWYNKEQCGRDTQHQTEADQYCDWTGEEWDSPDEDELSGH